MRNKSLLLSAVAFAFALAIGAYAVTVNPMSNVLGDSAATNSTLVYRDSNGGFSSTQIKASDSASGQFHPPTLTTATLITTAPNAVGDLYVAVNSVTNAVIHVCVATGTTAGAIVISTSLASPCKD